MYRRYALGNFILPGNQDLLSIIWNKLEGDYIKCTLYICRKYDSSRGSNILFTIWNIPEGDYIICTL